MEITRKGRGISSNEAKVELAATAEAFEGGCRFPEVYDFLKPPNLSQYEGFVK